jgi:hypothetical protein
MISERTFARSFQSFWDELLPLLTPSFVHVISELYRERLTDDFGFLLDPIARRADADSAMIAEFAFYLTKNATEGGISIRAAYDNPSLRSDAMITAATVVRSYEGAMQYPTSDLREDELREGFEIAENYRRFFDQTPTKGAIEFLPKIRGAGFLQNCQADISIGNALFEVKTVSRNLGNKDIKQLLVYLALQAATGNRRWSVGGFFNPRKADYVQFAIDEVLPQMSGGRSSSEVYHALLEFVSHSDVQFDSVF